MALDIWDKKGKSLEKVGEIEIRGREKGVGVHCQLGDCKKGVCGTAIRKGWNKSQSPHLQGRKHEQGSSSHDV